MESLMEINVMYAEYDSCYYCGSVTPNFGDDCECVLGVHVEDNKYADLDDEYDIVEAPRGSDPVNYRMATLNRVAGSINRHRKAGR